MRDAVQSSGANRYAHFHDLTDDLSSVDRISKIVLNPGDDRRNQHHGGLHHDDKQPCDKADEDVQSHGDRHDAPRESIQACRDAHILEQPYGAQ